MAQDTSDDVYGMQDPDELLQQQQDAYTRAQSAPNATSASRSYSAGLYGIQNAFGGGPAVNKARAVQAQFQSIMENVNRNSDPNEDPLTKQMRLAQAVSQGMIGVAPQIALKAQEQSIRLAQAQQQQGILNLKTQEAQQTLSQETFKNKILQNTPQTMFLAADQGKDENGIPLGYKEVKSYDLTDSGTPAAMRADMLAAQQNGQNLIPMTAEQLNMGKLQNAQAAAAARIQAAMQAAQARMYATDNKPPSAQNDRFTNRILDAADIGTASLQNVASLPMGSTKGFFGMNARPAQTLMEMGRESLYNEVQPQDAQLYNVMTQPLFRTLATIESGGGLQGASGGLMENIKNTLTLKPTDTYLTMLGKLAEARQIYDRGTGIYLKSKSVDPGVVQELQAHIDQMHKAVPWTPQDIIDFDRASKQNPGLTFSQYAAQQGVVGNSGQEGHQPTQFTSPPLGKDMHGISSKAVFGNGARLEDNGVGPADAASRGYGSVVDKALYGNQ